MLPETFGYGDYKIADQVGHFPRFVPSSIVGMASEHLDCYSVG
jgi:hypothetical protein